MPLCFVTKKFRDLHRVDELKNFTANIFLKMISKLRTGSRALKVRDFHYGTSSIVYWDKGSTVG